MAGVSAVGLAGFTWLIDIKGARRWFWPLEVLGLNSIVAYLISRPVTNVLKVHVSGISLYTILRSVTSPATATLLFAMTALMTVYCITWLLHRAGRHLAF
jgi:predicted acyltransferase